mmetsp:Transcript_29169/g.48547  ORF Transcript_29169/g.48547 Transcript_29169/m.48547 type:complete len:95 (-) Transcript_29169:448-732(-)
MRRIYQAINVKSASTLNFSRQAIQMSERAKVQEERVKFAWVKWVYVADGALMLLQEIEQGEVQITHIQSRGCISVHKTWQGNIFPNFAPMSPLT